MFHRPLGVTDTFPGILQAQECIDICTNSAKTLTQINTMAQDYIGGHYHFCCRAITEKKKKKESNFI